MAKQWGDIASAAKMRDLITKIVDKRIEYLRPAARYGSLVSVDTVAKTAKVQFAGESQPVPVALTLPSGLAAGDQVRVSGVQGDRYIDTPTTGTIIGTGGGGTVDKGSWVTLNIATTYGAFPSNKDEIAAADFVLDGTNDADVLAFLATAESNNTASRTIRFKMGTGRFVLNNPIAAAAGVTVVMEAVVPTRPGFETTELLINTNWDVADPVFKFVDANGALLLTGVRVIRANTSITYLLTNSSNVRLERCNVQGATRMFYPSLAGPSRFFSRECILHGSGTLPLFRAGFGIDPTGGTCLQFDVENSDVQNDVGPLFSLDDCPDWHITDNLLMGRGTSAIVQFRQVAPTTVARPAPYRQVLADNRLITTSPAPTNSPVASPFILFDDVRGAAVHNNLAVFVNRNPDDGLFLEAADPFVLINNYSAYNVFTDNQFCQAHGANWDNADLSTDGTLVPADILIDATSHDNTFWNPRQSLSDLNGNNETGLTADTPPVFFTNTDYVVPVGARTVIQNGTMDAPHTVTLPKTADVPHGASILIYDQSGTVSQDNDILVFVDPEDTMASGYGGSVLPIANPGGWSIFRADRINKIWSSTGLSISPDVTMGGVTPGDFFAPTQAAVQAYVIAYIAALPYAESLDDTKLGIATIVDGTGHEVTQFDPRSLATEDFVRGLAGETQTAKLRRVRNRLMLADTQPFSILAVGDSITEGATLTRPSDRWGHRLKDAFAKVAGVSSHSVGYVSANLQGGPLVSLVTGATGTLKEEGIGRRSWESSPTATNDRIWTVQCDRFTLHYTKGSGYGAFQVWVDGVLITTIDSYTAGTSAAFTYTSASMTFGTHVIKITSINTGSAKPVATFKVSIAGLFPYVGNYDKGIQYWDAGHGGYPSWDPTTLELNHFSVAKPDVVLIGFGVNDPPLNAFFGGGLTPADTVAHFQAMMNKINFQIVTAFGYQPLYVWVNWWGHGDSPNVEADWVPYHDAIKAAALAESVLDVIHLDVYEAFGYQGTTTTITDGVAHPNVPGSKAVADFITQALLGDLDRDLGVSRKVVPDINYTAVPEDRSIEYDTLTASRVVTMMPANSVAKGTEVLIVDTSGNASPSTFIQIACAGSDTAPGSLLGSYFIAGPRVWMRFKSDGISRWTVTSGSLPYSADATLGTTTTSTDIVLPTQKAVKTYVDSGGVTSFAPPAMQRRLRQQLARASTEKVRLYTIGDSITEGVGVSTFPERWINRVKEGLADYVGIPSPGVGYLPIRGAGGPITSAWTGSTGALGSDGPGQRNWVSASGATNYREITLECDRFELLYNKGSAYGAFTISIDGSVVATVDSYQAAAGPTAAHWDSGALTLGVHTIRFTSINTGSAKPVATYQVSLAGMMPYLSNYSNGLQLWDGSHSGWPSWTPIGVELDHIGYIQPDIVTLAYGVNDLAYQTTLGTGFTPADTAAHMLGAIDSIDYVTLHPVTFVVVIMWGYGSNPESDWTPYARAIRAMAVARGCVIVDLYQDIGWQDTTTELSDGAVHPNTYGSLAFADRVLDTLVGTVKHSTSTGHVALPGTADYRMTAQDRVVTFTGLTASRSVFLPPASSVPANTTIKVQDQSGLCSISRLITVNAVPFDTVPGSFGLSAATFLIYKYAAAEWTSDGVSSWSVRYSGLPMNIDGTLATTNNDETVSSAAVKVYVDAAIAALGGGGGSITLPPDADYTVLSTDREIYFATLTASRTVTMLDAAAVPIGTKIVIGDASGDIGTGGVSYILINACASPPNQVPGSFGLGQTMFIVASYGYVEFTSDGVSKWYAEASPLPSSTNTSLGTSDILVPTQNAVKTYADTKLAKSTATTKGDLYVATGSGVVVRKAVGAFGTVLKADSAETDGLVYGSAESLRDKYMKPSSSYETVPRFGLNVVTVPTASGTVYLTMIVLPKNLLVTNINWIINATAAGTPTHSWSALCNSSFVTLRSTVDATTGAIGSQALYTRALSSTFTTAYEGVYYLAIMVAATTVPTLYGLAGVGSIPSGIAPRLALTGLTGQTTAQADGTNLAPSPATVTPQAYGYVT